MEKPFKKLKKIIELKNWKKKEHGKEIVRRTKEVPSQPISPVSQNLVTSHDQLNPPSTTGTRLQ
uniref:Uncharacterized protein n=1 Tax=Glossina brevipalpis TaxID=37001 RepID=A0A1A9WY98_9MUSC